MSRAAFTFSSGGQLRVGFYIFSDFAEVIIDHKILHCIKSSPIHGTV